MNEEEYKIKKEELKDVLKTHPLRYLLSNNPDEVVSKSGVGLRRIAYRVMQPIIPLMNPYKINVIRKEKLPKGNRPIIYIANHGFKDDLLNLISLSGKPTYTLFGSLEQFYRTFDGYLVNLIGVSVVDRDSKESRNAVVSKWTKAINYGTNGLVFPEGIWNLEPHLIAHNFWPGFYRGLRGTNGVIVTSAFHIERNDKGKATLHIIRDKALDILSALACLRVATSKLNIDIKDKQYDVEDLVAIIRDSFGKININLDEDSHKIYNTLEALKILLEEVRTLDMDINTVSDEELVRKAMRSYLGSLLYEIWESIGIKSREELPSYEELEKQWHQEVKKRQSEPKYYTWNESDYRYCEEYERNIISETEVFSVLENVSITKDNALVLAKTKK